ncbi:MAG: YhcB family protein [bacterium]|nr:YhcB family protein [bacterium]
MEAWQLISLVGVFVVGLGAGTMFRKSDKKLRAHAEQLESELDVTREQLNSHKAEVSKHFEQTSGLFRDLTQQYTALYSHLAEGARELCPEMVEVGGGFASPLLTSALSPDEQIDEKDEVELDSADAEATPVIDADDPAVPPEEISPEELASAAAVSGAESVANGSSNGQSNGQESHVPGAFR